MHLFVVSGSKIPVQKRAICKSKGKKMSPDVTIKSLQRKNLVNMAFRSHAVAWVYPIKSPY